MERAKSQKICLVGRYLHAAINKFFGLWVVNPHLAGNRGAASWDSRGSTLGGTVFISYRRTDTSAWAGRISDDLEAKLPGVRLVFDVVSILPGQDFVEEIRRSVRDADVVLAVIGSGWLNTLDASGKRRLDDPLDFVRLELEIALNDDAVVIPVLIDGAQMPRELDLPEPLRRLSHRNAVAVTHANFKRDVEFLRESIAKILSKPKASPVAPAANITPRPARRPEHPISADGKAREISPTDSLIELSLGDAFADLLDGPRTANSPSCLGIENSNGDSVYFERLDKGVRLLLEQVQLDDDQLQELAGLISPRNDPLPEYGKGVLADDIDWLTVLTARLFRNVFRRPLSRPPALTIYGPTDAENPIQRYRLENLDNTFFRSTPRKRQQPTTPKPRTSRRNRSRT